VLITLGADFCVEAVRGLQAELPDGGGLAGALFLDNAFMG
jgi:hypothetical protein